MIADGNLQSPPSSAANVIAVRRKQCPAYFSQSGLPRAFAMLFSNDDAVFLPIITGEFLSTFRGNLSFFCCFFSGNKICENNLKDFVRVFQFFHKKCSV